MIRALAGAIGFLTVIPVPRRLLEPDLPPPGSMLWWWTPAGALLGALAALVACLALFWLRTTPLLAAVLVVVALAVLSGGLHLDGLMDTCDGLGSRAPREQALHIMKDPHVGAFGVIGLSCLLLVKMSALSSIAPASLTAAVVLAPIAGRATQVVALWAFGYARAEEGMGGAFFRDATPGHAALAVIVAIGAAASLGAWMPARIAAALLVAFLCALCINSRLGGQTGDTIGALSELAECAVLLACVG